MGVRAIHARARGPEGVNYYNMHMHMLKAHCACACMCMRVCMCMCMYEHARLVHDEGGEARGSEAEDSEDGRVDEQRRPATVGTRGCNRM